MRTAIVQIDIKPENVTERWHQDDALIRYHEELIAMSKKSFMHYAQVTGSDYILHTTALWPQYHPQVEIFRNLDKKRYDYVLCCDIDVVANTEENIFDYCVPGKINHVPRSQREQAKGSRIFNSGVVVFSNEMQDIWHMIDMDRTDKQVGRDQTELQMIMNQTGLGHELSGQFNNYKEWPHPSEVDLNAFLHFKGGQKESWYPKVREELLAKWK